MAAVGFGAGAQRWVSLLHAGTTARVAFNGWHTVRFPVQSGGVFQGSPLSRLLFVLAVQLMAAHPRQLAAQQGLRALSMPAGELAPFVHCHADDTTIHAASPADVAAILAGSISLYCQATGPRMQTADPTGMGIGSLQHLAGPDAATEHHIQYTRVSHHTPGHPPQHRPRRSGSQSVYNHPAAPR